MLVAGRTKDRQVSRIFMSQIPIMPMVDMEWSGAIAELAPVPGFP